MRRMTEPLPDLIYRRAASPALMAALAGRLQPLVTWRQDGDFPCDVQLRQSPKGSESWVSLYVGLTSVLDVYSRTTKGVDRFQLRAHTTHQAVGLSLPWGKWLALEELPVSEVLSYLDTAAAAAETRWTAVEGQVHAVLGREVTAWSIVNREASTSFRDVGTREKRLAPWRAGVTGALVLVDAEPWQVDLQSKSRGVSPDFLAVDDDGRLLVVEAKPGAAPVGIAGSPAQVAVYARALRAWLDQDPVVGRATIESQLAQRVALGLSPSRLLAEPITVVPVVVVGWGLTSTAARTRLERVAQALDRVRPDGVEPLEVYRVSPAGELAGWPVDAAVPPYTDCPVVARTFEQRARIKAVQWKLAQGIVEDGVYCGQPYPFCLPGDRSRENLLPASAGAVDFFATRRIRWHKGINGGPSNHLLSSQVQCVNALFPMAAADVKQVFGTVLPVGEVLPLDGGTVTFEYGGRQDYLRERRGVRGAWATWADAAFEFSDRDDPTKTCIALVEWKFTESYRPSVAAWKPAQIDRYRALVEARDVITPAVAFDELRGEPYYQLMRQQLLAWAMEEAGEADCVYVVHVSPAGDTAYHAHLLAKPWLDQLVHPSRFVELPSERFLGRDSAYDARYDVMASLR